MLSNQSISRGIRFSLDMYETLINMSRMQHVTLNVLIVRLLQEKIHEYYQHNIAS
jgi:hypothetical protein